MAVLSPLADSVRMSAALGMDAHASFYPNPVDVSGIENSSHVILTFRNPCPKEVFPKPTGNAVELRNCSESQEELPLPPVCRKRAHRRSAECNSGDEFLPKSARRRSQVSYRESDSSSEGESENGWLPHVAPTWRPDADRRPCLDDAPVFYPNEEEFKNPLEYIASIRPRAEPYGICRVVPPQPWRPPCPLQEGSPELQSMQFPTRMQEVHKLQVREPIAKESSPGKQASKKQRGRPSLGRMGGLAARTNPATPHDHQEYFGFEHADPFSLGAFEKYANDFKEQHFRSSDPHSTDAEQKWEPTIEMIEGEYWRIVEQATDQIEVLYGADVDTGKFGSGFPKAKPGAEAATCYEKSGWNLNNIARFPGSMLSLEEGDISGVLVPWLYIGMCFSSFCWHVEDHHLYSLNYLHWGAPKIWYGVPGSAADKLEASMKKHLPDLFNEQPDLLHKLVTQLAPSFLKQEGVPVYRLVQRAGEFVITFPRAYHSGFNAGFNVAEAVNVAPVDWLAHGQAAVELYRELHRKTSVSHDKLLLGAAKVAVKMWWHSQQKQKLPQETQTGDACNKASNGQGDGLEPGFVSAWQGYCGEGGVLAKALEERVEMEHARREWVEKVAGGDGASPLSMQHMDSGYDVTDERECEVCKYDLHLSAVGCQCCPDRFACLLHGHLLCSCLWSKKTLLYRYHLDQLCLLLAAVEGRPGAVADWTNLDSELPAPLIPKEGTTYRQGVEDIRGDVATQTAAPPDQTRNLPKPECELFPESDHANTAVGSAVAKKQTAAPGPTSVKQRRPPLCAPDFILLSDDEDDRKIPEQTCKLNEAVEAFAETESADEGYSLTAAAVDCASNSGQEGQALHSVAGHSTLADVAVDRNESSPDELSVQPGCGASIRPRGPQRPEREVELLDTGRLVLREGWHSRHAIYPAGFRSAARFTDVADVSQTCMYVSEIVDRGRSARPLFKVTHPTTRDVYSSESVDECWHEVQKRVDEEITARRSQHSCRQPPPLLPPPPGLQMFGLRSASIIEAVEALDPLRHCAEYWSRKPAAAEREQGHCNPDAKQAQELQRGDTCISTTGGLRPVTNSGETAAAADARAARGGRCLMSSGARKESQRSYAVLRGFFQKASAEELRVLYCAFAGDASRVRRSAAFRALADEVQRRVL